MANNPVERNFVTRFLLGFAVIAGMTIAGGGVGQLFVTAGVPYGRWIGVGVGAVLAFAVFAAWYVRYDDSFAAE